MAYSLLRATCMGSQAAASLVHGLDEAAVRERLAQDPFVANGLVEVELGGFTPAKTDARLQFLLPA
jgi:hypothetical protein